MYDNKDIIEYDIVDMVNDLFGVKKEEGFVEGLDEKV